MPNIRNFLTSILLVISLGTIHGQALDDLNRRAQNWFKEGSSSLAQGDFGQAAENFDRVLSRYPHHFLSKYYSGISHFELGNYQISKRYFKELTEREDLNPMYNDSWLLLGQSLMRLGKYKEAVEPISRFSVLESEGRWTDVALRWKKTAEFAAEATLHPVEFQPEELNIPLEDHQSAYLPMKSLDGRALFFVIREGGRETLVRTEKLEGSWSKLSPLGFLEGFAQAAAPSLSPDGNLLLLTICNHPQNIGSCDLYLASRDPNLGHWRGPFNLGEQVNSRGWDSQATFAPDGRTFFFSSDRAGGMGGRDIWFSRLLTGGNFSPPVNAGPLINTSENEASPFIHPDGKTLYFKSNGHIGMGDYDLFVSRLDENGGWGEPVNLGYPINTMDHDGAIFVESDGKTAYMASDRFQPADRRGIYRIFRFELPEEARGESVTFIKAMVKDAETLSPLTAYAQIVNTSDGTVVYNHKLGTAGTLFAVLQADAPYSLNIEKKGYSFVSRRIIIDPNATAEEPLEIEILLQPVSEVDTVALGPVVLENVLFDFGSYSLDSSSIPELDRLVSYLGNVENVVVEIHGHTDNIGSMEANLLLSEKRAQSVVDYLVSGGVKESRIVAKGLGSKNPVADNDTEEGRALNRRIEMHLIPLNRPSANE